MNEAKPGVLLITIDCGRADMTYSDEVETPNIDKLRKAGITFTNAYSQSNITIPSLCSMFTSRYVSSHGNTTLNPSKYNGLGDDSLPIILARNGWKVASFLGFDLLAQTMGRDIDNFMTGKGQECHQEQWNWKRKFKNKFKKKINIFSPFIPIRIQTEVVRRRNFKSKIEAGILVDNLLRWLSSLKNERFFGWIHFFDAHLLYQAPRYWVDRYYKKPQAPFSRSAYEQLKDKGIWFPEIPLGPILKCEKDINLYPSLYRAALAHIDHQIGRILEWLEKNGEIDRSIIIVTSDHGENLMNNGIYCGHVKLFDETTRVPLIFRDPSAPHGNEVSSLVQHIDLMPTLCERLSLTIPVQAQGKSLWPAIWNDKILNYKVFSEHSHSYQKTLRTEKWQYLWANPEKTDPWGLEFEGGVLLDRHERGKKNYASFHPDICHEMEEMIRELSKGFTSIKDEDEEVSQEIVDRLAALGYIDS